MILSASGGLVYHTRAAFNFLSWRPTRRSVSMLVRDWIARAQPEKLIIVGPSAGYLLERDIFASTHELVVIDPDPLAAILFRQRFRSPKTRWIQRADLLPFFSETPDAFSNFITSESKGKSTAVLFFGVLGQIDLHRDSFARSKTEGNLILLQTLNGISWASLHDLESTVLGARKKRLDYDQRNIAKHLNHIDAGLSPQQRIEEASSHLEGLGWQAENWIDHESSWIGKPSHVIPWMLTLRRLHHLGWTSFVGIDQSLVTSRQS